MINLEGTGPAKMPGDGAMREGVAAIEATMAARGIEPADGYRAYCLNCMGEPYDAAADAAWCEAITAGDNEAFKGWLRIPEGANWTVAGVTFE
jgi:hypothetical protein